MKKWVWKINSGYQLVHLSFLEIVAAPILGLGSRFSLVISLGSMEEMGLNFVLGMRLCPRDEGKILLVSRLHFMLGFMTPS